MNLWKIFAFLCLATIAKPVLCGKPEWSKHWAKTVSNIKNSVHLKNRSNVKPHPYKFFRPDKLFNKWHSPGMLTHLLSSF